MLHARSTGPGIASALVGLALAAAADAAPEKGFRVLHHEAIQVTRARGTGAAEHLSFQAYGRQFDLQVMPNERIRRAMPGEENGTMPFEGTVEGAPRSWVRVTRSATGLRGMMFDGTDMYAIETAADIEGSTVQPLEARGDALVVYRLQDALLPLDDMTCEIALPEGPSTAADAFQQISKELQTHAMELTTLKQVRVGVVGDTEFSNQFSGLTPEEAIVARMNIVDGIFSSQLGVKVSLAPPTLFRSGTDPFTKQKASELLTELRAYRGSSPAQLALGLTHLMTGRDLEGDTVGIAYIGAVCDGRNAASLSEGRRSHTTAALIAAHEIGHNFNAPHDGDAEGACSDTPSTFLMAARLNGSDQFSACSVRQIAPVVRNAWCLATYIPPDATLEVANPIVAGVVGTALVASFKVRATGDDASINVSVSATIPAELTLENVSANGGTCTGGAGIAHCELGTLAAGDTRQVDFRLVPTEAGSFPLSLTLDAANDPNASNDSGIVTISATTEPVPPPPPTGGGTSPPATNSSGGGGGGRADLTLLGLLAVALITARRKLFGPRRL